MSENHEDAFLPLLCLPLLHRSIRLRVEENRTLIETFCSVTFYWFAGPRTLVNLVIIRFASMRSLGVRRRLRNEVSVSCFVFVFSMFFISPLLKAYSRSYAWPRMQSVTIHVSCACNRFHDFPCLQPVTNFPALATGYIFYPSIQPVTNFPAHETGYMIFEFETGCMFSRACNRWQVFARFQPVSSFPALYRRRLALW